MSKTLRTVALVAGAVALAATGVGAVGSAGLLGATGAGTAAAATIATATSIATYASVAAGIASVGAQLTAKKPAARGSITETIIQVDPPQPYMMGRTYSAGVLRHDIGYGPEIDDVKNPYRGIVVVYSGSGPIQEIESRQFDYQPLSFSSGWYLGYVGAPGQLGTTPEPAALVAPLGTLPQWGSDYKLSGQAAVLWNFKFDKKGKRYASGIPPYGIVAKGVRVYDPRLDSTYPGGSGSHRITNEATWTYSENPALHALAYAYGRHQNGKKVLGVGLPISGIDRASFVTLANICDANNWKVGGTIFEGPGINRWENLKDILAAGGAEPVFAGGTLSVRYRAPMVALDTITEHDIADDDMQVTAMQSYRDRSNGIVPKYRSEAHNWQYVSTETVSVPAWVTEDGEEKTHERQLNLVQDPDQAAQLATYELVDGREMGPITLTLKPQWRRYKPGECLHLTLPSLEIDHDAIILSREFDPGTMTVRLTFVTKTAGMDAFALGQTATPPPTPTLTDPADRDDAMADPYVAHLPDLTDEAGVLLDSVVATENVVSNAITDRYIATLVSNISLPNNTETDVFSITVIKGEAESDVDLDVALRLQSSDDIRGAIRIYRDTTLITSFGPYMNGAGGTFRIVLTLPHSDFGVPVGTYVYKVTFERQGGASSLIAAAGSLIRGKEYKR